MRTEKRNAHLAVKVVAGTHVILMALDMPETDRQGLRGFAIKRGIAGHEQTWLRGTKYFEELVPNHKVEDDFASRDQPFQTFLWSDFQAQPQTRYDFTIIPLYGDLKEMREGDALDFSVETEAEDDDKHGVWFNRGALASHALATQFNNKAVTEAMAAAVDADGNLTDKETKWLSRGLAEACLRYIHGVKPGEGLRVCAYEFTYAPILNALKRAHDNGVDLRIIYHATDANKKAIAAAGLPDDILIERTRPPIPHNKFIVKLVGGAPHQVWTGSTNFTSSGFLGQTNVGHLATGAIAKTYLDYWTGLSDNPVHSAALADATGLTPNPPNALTPTSTVGFFSPRVADNMLDWYAQRIGDAASLVMMTIPFNVAPRILIGLSKTRDALRTVILEDEPSAEVKAAEVANQGRLLFSNGALVGKNFIKVKGPAGGAKITPIPQSDLDRWFIDEELPRPTNKGHVFFVHSKVLLIDPLSDDPLVCSGSANFSTGSLITNDENMLLIRGETRVADIYMTELDRIFRHFQSRNAINDLEREGHHDNPLALDPTDKWIAPNFASGTYKNNRRLLFFPPAAGSVSWVETASRDPNPFEDEVERSKAKRDAANSRARERRGAGTNPRKASPKKAGVKKTSAKKASAKKGSARKTSVKKASARKTSVKKTGAGTKPSHRSPSKKVALKRTSKKLPSRKTGPAKKLRAAPTPKSRGQTASPRKRPRST